MSRDNIARPTAAERQNVRAVAAQAAATLAAAEFTQIAASKMLRGEEVASVIELRVATQQWTHEIMQYIENGRWSDDQPTR